MPKVSIIIPVHNREIYISDAVNSTLSQTFRDLELIIIDDGSTDRTPEILDSFRDRRIRVLRNDANAGIPVARNQGLSEANGKYIAWLDSDDMMAPARISIQVEYLDNHAQLALLGTCAGKCDAGGRGLRGIRVPPLNNDDIRAWLLFRSAFQHSSLMGRSEVLQACPYREDLPVCEDLDLFIRIAESHKLENLPRVLVTRRIHDAQTIRLHGDLIVETQIEIFQRQLKRIGKNACVEDVHRHILLANLKQRGIKPDMEYLDWAEDWLAVLQQANRVSQYCAVSSLEFVAGLFWSVACWHARRTAGLRAYRKFLSSPLRRSLVGRNGHRWLKHYMPLVMGQMT